MAEFQSQQFKSRAKASAKGKGHGFSTKCASLVKQQRARLYILRRCATMLLCCSTITISIPQLVSHSLFIIRYDTTSPIMLSPRLVPWGIRGTGEVYGHTLAFSPSWY
ncbi:hypothetical protein V6N13_105090 [Hibiscus sabdariffa]|uniref:Uncharacterized protein n=1 Tax=Hibiscus sabdariffa TaxID=183260 RepID=A0ABR2SJN6_9ROSI